MKQRLIILLCNILVLPFIVLAYAHAVHTSSRHTPEDLFFQMTRFIMTKEEIKIYRYLPDEPARQEFIREFWAKRNPIPDQEENPCKIEYERRIEYANKWFKDRPDGRGWDTERGHLLLQLGIPTERRRSVTTMFGTTWTVIIDEWYYADYNLYLYFADTRGQGKFELQNWPDELLDALDNALLALDINNPEAIKNSFTFSAKYHKKKQAIEITIPIKHIEFEEKENQVVAIFAVYVTVFRDYRKVAVLEKEETIKHDKTTALSLKQVSIMLPYVPTEKGSYLLEVILKEQNRGIRYRTFCHFKQ